MTSLTCSLLANGNDNGGDAIYPSNMLIRSMASKFIFAVVSSSDLLPYWSFGIFLLMIVACLGFLLVGMVAMMW